MRQTFNLIPHPDHPVPAEIGVAGEIRTEGGMVNVTYRLSGDLAPVHIPRAAGLPLRLDNLWRTTCFEMFASEREAETYWEFNLSPAGDWNVYRFDTYRQGQCPEMQVSNLTFDVKHQPESLELVLAFDLATLLPGGVELEVGLTAVVEVGNQVTYWALQHGPSEPDFHNRNTFLLAVSS